MSSKVSVKKQRRIYLSKWTQRLTSIGRRTALSGKSGNRPTPQIPFKLCSFEGPDINNNCHSAAWRTGMRVTGRGHRGRNSTRDTVAARHQDFLLSPVRRSSPFQPSPTRPLSPIPT
ncbi:hypothetical protein BaRGS_00005231 [Batillaria attramentaria]|uniref:Ribosomal protein L20 n=1 Tax=Batillaria attramentaria TaxID=370345 RepID=A0ABD0LWF4_9CAEN